MSSPSINTLPAVGGSRPPKICNKVVLPEPEAPTIATRSPEAISSSMPRSTSSVTGPWRKLLCSASARRTGGSNVMMQRLRGRGARSAPRGIERRERAQDERHAADARHVGPLDPGRQVAHAVHARIEEMRAEQALEPVHRGLHVMRAEDPEPRPERRPGEPDQYPLQRERREHVARTGAERAQDRDVALLL